MVSDEIVPVVGISTHVRIAVRKAVKAEKSSVKQV